MNYPIFNYPFCFICNSIVQNRIRPRMEDYCKKCNISYVHHNYKNIKHFIAFYNHKDEVDFILVDNNWIYKGEGYHTAFMNISKHNSWTELFEALNKCRTFG